MGADGALGYVGAASESEMFRKTLTILSLIGLLLSVGLWGVSYFCDVCYVGDSGSYVSAWLGALWIGSDEIADRARRGDTTTALVRWRMNVGCFPRWPTFHQRGSGFILILPLWMPAIVCMSVLFWLYLPLHRRRKRKKLGLCLKCGYDLRASKDRCPECGTEIQKTGANATMSHGQDEPNDP